MMALVLADMALLHLGRRMDHLTMLYGADRSTQHGGEA
jgi:hypothetical protein